MELFSMLQYKPTIGTPIYWRLTIVKLIRSFSISEFSKITADNLSQDITKHASAFTAKQPYFLQKNKGFEYYIGWTYTLKWRIITSKTIVQNTVIIRNTVQVTEITEASLFNQNNFITLHYHTWAHEATWV